MKKHLRYLSYVARHKFFVLLAAHRIGASLWLALIHDWSKFLPCEWNPYTEFFYGKQDERCEDRNSFMRKSFDRAWLHHQHHNPHHWQHWVLRLDDGGTVALEMPYRFATEMVADWMGAGRAITGKWEAAAWYAKNSGKMLLHSSTRLLVESLLEAK